MITNTIGDFLALMEEQIILVDKDDNITGSCDKLTVHREGLLHRAFSVFILNSKDQFLVQKRAAIKYHSAGLWSNTCCGHPRPGEDIITAAQRRLFEETGMRNVKLIHLFKFKYKAVLDNGFTEHELDHVFIGRTDAIPLLNATEAEDYTYLNAREIEEKLETEPEKFTYWFRILFDEVRKKINLR